MAAASSDQRLRVLSEAPEEEDGDEDESEDEDSLEANDAEEDPDAGDGLEPLVRGPLQNGEGEVVPLDPADGR